jgi:hypothetical protein
MKKRPSHDTAAIRRRAAIAAGLVVPLAARPTAAQQRPAEPVGQPTLSAVADLVVDTMVELKQLTARPRLVLLSGYRTPTDQGGGLFTWHAADSSPPDDGLIVQPENGAAGRYRRIYGGEVLAQWFGVVGDGVANDTEALERFLKAVADTKVGRWGGTYAIDEGVLVIAPPPGERVVRDGSLRYFLSPCLLGDVTFIGRGTGPGPFLSIRNPPQHTGSGEVMAGGTLGNLTFIDRTRSTLTTRHGLFAQGLYNWTINALSGYGLGGSVYSTSRASVAIGGFPDPDAYANSLNRIGSVLAVDCNGYAYDADDLTEAGNVIGFIGAYGPPAAGTVPFENGIMRNSGQGTEVHASASSETRGWAFKYGAAAVANRQLTYDVEITSENGIWIAALEQFEITGRIIIDNVRGQAWPRCLLKLGGTGRSVFNGRINLLFRINPGVTLAMLGNLIDFSNDPNIGDVEINLVAHDESRTGLFNGYGNLSDGLRSLVSNLHPIAGITLKVHGTSVLTQYRTTAIRVRLQPGTGSLPSAGFGTPESRLRGVWTSQGGDDHLGILDAGQHRLRISAQGRYRVHCHLCLPVGGAPGTIAPGSLVRYGLIVDDGQGNLEGLIEAASLVQDAGGVHHLAMDVAAAPLRAGSSLWISLEVRGQNGECTLHGVKFANASNVLELHLLPPD